MNGKLDGEEAKKREDIRADFDKAVREFKQKVSGEVNEEALKKKNEELKGEMQKMVEENKKKSEEIEQKIKEKQKSSEGVQEKLKNMMQSKLEELLSDSTREKKAQIELIQKEQELKAQIQMYESNFDQLNDSIKKSGKVFSQLKKEIKKKAEMHKTVDLQKNELQKTKEGFDSQIVDLNGRLSEINAEKDAIKAICQALQKELVVKPPQ